MRLGLTQKWIGTCCLVILLSVLAACDLQRGIDGLKVFDHKNTAYRSGSIRYLQTPPAGGPHNALWQNCGVYKRPLYNEYAVHSLSHGALWVTYRRGTDQATVNKLLEALNDHPKLLLSPYDSLPSPIVLTVWNAQLHLDQPEDPRLQRFLDKYGDGHTAPERDALCGNGYKGTK